jgi:hypothetical protein
VYLCLLSKNKKLTCTKVQLYSLFCVGVKLGLLTLREERRLRMSENRVLRRIFGPNRNETRESWIKLHNEELRNLHSSLMFKSEKDEMSRTCVMLWRKSDFSEPIGSEGRGVRLKIYCELVQFTVITSDCKRSDQ